MNSLLAYAFENGVATIQLDDGKANVMSIHMLAEINEALDRALADRAVVVITGRSGIFSGGFDLNVFKNDAQESVQMLEAGARLTERLLSFPRPVLVACSGHAIAMGLFIVLCGDVRIAVDQDARFQANEVQIGLTLPRFAAEVCRQRMTPAHFNLAGITAHSYLPPEALQAGIVDEIVNPEMLSSVTAERAQNLVSLNAEAFTATKLRLRQPVITALNASIIEDLSGWNSRYLKQV